MPVRMKSHDRYLSVLLVLSAGGFLPCLGNIDGNEGEGSGLWRRYSLNDGFLLPAFGTVRYLGGFALLASNILLPGIRLRWKIAIAASGM